MEEPPMVTIEFERDTVFVPFAPLHAGISSTQGFQRVRACQRRRQMGLAARWRPSGHLPVGRFGDRRHIRPPRQARGTWADFWKPKHGHMCW